MFSYSSPMPPSTPASTTSVSTLHFASPSQPFSNLQNSPGNTGTQRSSHFLTSLTNPVNSPHKASSFAFQSPSPTSSEKAQSFHYVPQGMDPAMSEHNDDYSGDLFVPKSFHYSDGQWAPVQRAMASRKHSQVPSPCRPPTHVTSSVEELRTAQSPPG